MVWLTDFMSIMSDAVALIPTILLFIAALMVGRSWLLLLPFIAWPMFFLGLHAGWWGHGVGDAWQYALGILTLVGVAVVGAGLLLRRLALRGR